MTLSPPGSWSAALADHAVRALVDEAELTPKPGLVDRRGGGCHADMTLTTMRRSAHALRGGFVEMARTASGYSAADQELRMRLASIGRQTETAMHSVTGGVNTHRGAIWALGLLISSAAMSPEGSCSDAIASTAGEIARYPDPDRPHASTRTNGFRTSVRHGVPGARGQARAGFPHVLRVGLPTLRRSRTTSGNEDDARLDTLVALMAELDDTCILSRGGADALAAVRTAAHAVMAVGGTGTARGRRELSRLDRLVATLGVSPGGSADLLAATLLLDRITPVSGARAGVAAPPAALATSTSPEASWRN